MELDTSASTVVMNGEPYTVIDVDEDASDEDPLGDKDGKN